VVGGVRRLAPSGEWRTNVALGATRAPLPRVPAAARALAVRAASALRGQLVGVDLLPTPDGGWTVLEVNGAVQFGDAYGGDIHRRAAGLLVREACRSQSASPPIHAGGEIPAG
jgi:glutathione synthase/RimK-type ligase-like ATP-grasp enzyme